MILDSTQNESIAFPDSANDEWRTPPVLAKGPSINNSVNSLFDGMFSVPARSCSSNRRERDGGRD